MSFDNSGALLEGIRLGTGNSPFDYPPRNFISDSSAFNSITRRAEYCILADSTDPTKVYLGIADPELIFRWTKNESTVIRFDYDGYSRRWMPSPGSAPVTLGKISQNLVIQVPDTTVTNSSYNIYIGYPVRSITFITQIVQDSGSFTNPAPGTVQVSQADGKLNFNTSDLSVYADQNVMYIRQSFFDRTKTKGIIGKFPDVSSPMFLNPKPSTGQRPRVRIGYQAYLTPNEVPDEASLGSPASGTFNWSLDTGRVRFNSNDATLNVGINAYYDGVTIGSFSISRVIATNSIHAGYSFTIAGYDNPNDDPSLYLIFAEKGTAPRSYWAVAIVNGPGRPPPGTVYIDKHNGKVYFSRLDASLYVGWSIGYVKTAVQIENGVTVQFYRSAVNYIGPEVRSDFAIGYDVIDQIIIDNIGQSPTVMLPTNPIVNSNLKYSIIQGASSSGTFTGDLVDGTNPALQGVGYILDLDNFHQLQFTNRKTVNITLEQNTPVIKLSDAVISSLGFVVTYKLPLFSAYTTITPGIDFDFDPNTGLLEFIQSVGENEGIPTNLGINGTCALPNVVASSTYTFNANNLGQYIYISSGSNAGLYTIIGIDSGKSIVSPNLIVTQSDKFDVRTTAEIIADRFWTDLIPPFKKLTVSKASSPTGAYGPLSNTQYNVFANTGQINLSDPLKPGESIRVDYIWLQSPDEGVTVTPTPVTEKALFPIRQETCTITPHSSVLTFNPTGRIVNTTKPIQLYLDGVTQDAGSFQFVAPGSIIISSSNIPTLATVNYWVEDAAGGENNFNLINSPIDVDFLQISSNATNPNVFSVNGDNTGTINSGSALLINKTDVSIVKYVTYDSISDTTSVTLEKAPIIDFSGTSIQVTGPVTENYRILDANAINTFDVFIQGTNSLFVKGSTSYLLGMIITLDGDPYLLASVTYDSSKNKTKLTMASNAKKNYIMPIVTHTIRPVFDSNNKNVQTSSMAHLKYPFTLIRMGASHDVLKQGIDYTVASGGVINLSISIHYGDILYALYVGYKMQPKGSKFKLNYAYAISPDEFGLVGQQLKSTYRLYAPDSFFYRVETFASFQPEVVGLLAQGTQSGGVSGPNTANASSMKTKDYGVPSLYFDEQHLANIDSELRRLLKFYNDLVNQYEDILSNIDGRVVGGVFDGALRGKFRFDGNVDNPPRNPNPSSTNLEADSFNQITNDIDDRIFLYNIPVLSGFDFPNWNFTYIPVYARMADPSVSSRLFPTRKLVTSAIIGAQTGADKFGQIMGDLQQKDITATSSFVSTPANAIFTKVESLGTVFTIDKNGDAALLNPEFKVGQEVQIYSPSGVPDPIIGSRPTIASIDTTGLSPKITLNLNGNLPTSLTTGCLLQNTSNPNVLVPPALTVPMNHFYTPGRDIIVNNNTGQLINTRYPPLPPPLPQLDSMQNPPKYGDELIDCMVAFVNSDMNPRRFPALDGLSYMDTGHVSAPQLKYTHELYLLEQELIAIASLGSAKVQPDFITITDCTIGIQIGDIIKFLTGPNAGYSRGVVTITPAITVNYPFPYADAVGNTFILDNKAHLQDVLAEELKVLYHNTATPPVPPAYIGKVDSEINSVINALLGLGSYPVNVFINSSGPTSTTDFTDNNTDFLGSGVTSSCYLYIKSGNNQGVYKVKTVTTHTITIDVVEAYVEFPSVGVKAPYLIIKPWSFVSSKEFDFVTKFLRDTMAFYWNTVAFSLNITGPTITARLIARSARLAVIADEFLPQLTGLLGTDDKLYDTRYLWIQSRVNRKDGVLVQQTQAAQKRAENLAKLLADQQRLLIAQSL